MSKSQLRTRAIRKKLITKLMAEGQLVTDVVIDKPDGPSSKTIIIIVVKEGLANYVKYWGWIGELEVDATLDNIIKKIKTKLNKDEELKNEGLKDLEIHDQYYTTHVG
jgi:hypothetical protein